MYVVCNSTRKTEGYVNKRWIPWDLSTTKAKKSKHIQKCNKKLHVEQCGARRSEKMDYSTLESYVNYT
jgi:hypothetical protein